MINYRAPKAALYPVGMLIVDASFSGAMADGLSVFILSLFSLPAVGATTYSENVGAIAMTRVSGVYFLHSLRKDTILPFYKSIGYFTVYSLQIICNTC